MDLISKSYVRKTNSIEFENDENKTLRDLAIYIKKQIKNIIKEHFNKETHLGDFANRIYDKELSFNETKEEQKDFLKETDELEDRIEAKREKQPNNKN